LFALRKVTNEYMTVTKDLVVSQRLWNGYGK